MNNIQASLENLIKTNNGFFKSDAQKVFLTAELKKEIKRLEKAITARNSAFDAGDYAALPELYNKANNSDLEQLAAFKKLLNDYVI